MPKPDRSIAENAFIDELEAVDLIELEGMIPVYVDPANGKSYMVEVRLFDLTEAS